MRQGQPTAIGRLVDSREDLGSPWLVGESPVYADFVIAGEILWCKATGEENWERMKKVGGGRWERFVKACEPWIKYP